MPSPFDPYLDADLPTDSRQYLGQCDCHLRGRSVRGEGRCSSADLPDPSCRKCGGDGDLFAAVESRQ